MIDFGEYFVSLECDSILNPDWYAL